jgi:hypothetical protein
MRGNAPLEKYRTSGPARPPYVIAFGQHRDAVWRGNRLMLCGRCVATVVPDVTWPKMWRVKLPNGHVTDMVNKARAKDAALTLGAAALRES